MNSTNRGANRLLIFVCGLLLVVVGAAGAGAVIVPEVRDGWKSSADQISAQVQTWFERTQIEGINNSWIMPAILVLLVVAVIILISFIAKQGRGHTGTAFDEETSENGRTVIESSVAEHVMNDALAGRSEFVASSVSTYSVKRTPVLKVSVTCRRGVSPRDAADIVEQKLRALDVLLGRELPALVQVSGGFRSRVTKTTRL